MKSNFLETREEMCTSVTICEREIWGSHGGEDDDFILLDYDAVKTRRLLPTFRRNILCPSLGLNMGIVCFYETLEATYESARRHNPEEQRCKFVNDLLAL
jgi:hypothetical protein